MLFRSKWVYGDRVFSKFKGTPTIGMVIRERDKEVLIHSDLPVKIGKVIHNIISVPVRDVKRLKEM